MKRVQLDDIQVGSLVSVANPRTYQRAVGGGMFGDGPATIVDSIDRSYMGDVYRVLAIDAPYVVVEMVVSRSGSVPKPGTFDAHPRSIHTGEYPLSLVSDEYVKALTPEVPHD